MGSGGGKSGGASSGDALEDISKQLFSETTPLRQETISQMLEALTTGGIGARIPMIGRAVESSKRATSETMRGVDDRLAVMGLSGSPFGENIRAGTKQAGDQATSQIPTNIAQQFITGIPNFVLGQGQTVVSGLGTAGQVQNQAQANAMAPWLAMMPKWGYMGGG